MNGKQGDDPATDILLHGRAVFSPETDALVRELGKLMELRRVQELLRSHAKLAPEALGNALRAELTRLRAEAKSRGWETP
jgi:hypothetical protein